MEDVELTFEVDLRLDMAAGGVLGLARSCVFFDDLQCGHEIDETVAIGLLEGSDGFFTTHMQPFMSPVGSRSMDCRFDFESTGTPFELYLDRVMLRIDAGIFADGFESGDTARWASSAP